MQDLLRYGNDLEISGFLMANGQESHLILLPKATRAIVDKFIQPTHEELQELIYQMDVLGVQGDDKTVLRKTQRQIEQTVTWNVYRRDDYSCRYCGKNNIPLTVDHIVLWEKMGDSIEGNLISSCSKCNKTRGNKEFDVWVVDSYYIKVMQESLCPLSFDERHQKNLDAGIYAKTLPPRSSKRNR